MKLQSALALIVPILMGSGALPSCAGTYSTLGADVAPGSLDPDGAFGTPAFDERFEALDAGDDQIKPPHPHRWRTVFGYGGPSSAANRTTGDAYFDGSALTVGKEGLVITATRRRSPFGREWQSGLLTTKFSFSQPWGYFEATMDIPICDKGIWPAFWLLPTTGVWPHGGEVDAPEAIGDGKLYWSWHAAPEGHHVFKTIPSIPAHGCARGSHSYGALVTPEVIAFYYDRRKVAVEPTSSDFGQPLMMLIDLATGGSWAGKPSPELQKSRMYVRRVAAWRLPRGAATHDLSNP